MARSTSIGDVEVKGGALVHDVKGDAARRDWHRSAPLAKRSEVSVGARDGESTDTDDAERDREGERGRRQRRRQSDSAELVVGVDRQRRGVVGQDDDRAVLAKGAQPREHHARAHALTCRGEGHAPEFRDLAVAERRRHVKEPLIECSERRACRHDQKRCAYEGHRDHDAEHRVRQMSLKESSQPGVGAHDVNENDPTHQRW